MSTPAYGADIDRACQAARDAGELALDAWRGELDVRHKAADQPVTDADLAADQLIRATLLDAFPDDGWLSEESPDHAARLGKRRVWVVDPIDGTRSFVARRPEFTISIALVEDGDVVAGVIFNPATGELFHARRGGGAFRDADGVTQRLAVRPETPARGLLLASRGEIASDEHAPFAGDWDVAPVGSTAYKLARIAAGEADGYVSRGPKSEWDVAAGVLLVEEAGGRVADLHGSRPRFNRSLPEIAGIVAAGGVYDRLFALAGALPPVERLRHRVPDALHPGLQGREG